MQYDLVDYARPLIEAEALLKRVYDLMLHNEPDKAVEACMGAVKAVNEAHAAILLQRAKNG